MSKLALDFLLSSDIEILLAVVSRVRETFPSKMSLLAEYNTPVTISLRLRLFCILFSRSSQVSPPLTFIVSTNDIKPDLPLKCLLAISSNDSPGVITVANEPLNLKFVSALSARVEDEIW